MLKVETRRPNYIVVSNNYNVVTAFSYDTPIVSRIDNKIILHTAWAYSSTTGKHRNDFLGEGIAETRKKLLKGEYTLKPYEEM